MSNQNLIFETFDEVCDWAADNHFVVQNCEGTPEETLMAGWVNAMDHQDYEKGALTEEELMMYAYSEFKNMGYDKD